MIPGISEPSKLTEKIAIVTGAARGIGRAISIALQREGARVVPVDIASLEDTCRLMDTGAPPLPQQCDLTMSEHIEKVVAELVEQFGRIDILINNAAIVGSYGRELEAYTEEEWDCLIDTNLKSTFLMTRAVWPHMRRQGTGKIVCIGSIAGKIGGLFAGPHYCASKGGVHGFVRWAAKNGAKHGILVNGIAPGPVVTEMTVHESSIQDSMIPLGRLGRPEDIAEPVVFLASPASNFITGCVLDVNGGLLMA